MTTSTFSTKTRTDLLAKDLKACWDEYVRLRDLADPRLQLLVDMAYARWVTCSRRDR